MFKSKLIAVLGLSLMGSLAYAGTWTSPSLENTFQVTNTMDLNAIAGTSNTAPVSGYCTVGAVHYYFQTHAWLCRFKACRGVMTVHRQTCI